MLIDLFFNARYPRKLSQLTQKFSLLKLRILTISQFTYDKYLHIC